MKHRIRMVGFDLDGTLLTTDKKLTGYTKEILRRAIKEGVTLLPVTGRPLSGVPEEISGFEGIRHMITSNGARILEERFGDFVSSPAMAAYMVSTRIPIKDIRAKFEEENRSLDKIQALFCSREDQEEAWKRVEALGDVEVTGSLSMNIEVNAGGVHKGLALGWLAKRLGIEREEVMAFGDGLNDVGMIREAGCGVAMANAVPSVLEAADMVTMSNDEDGVARAVEKYVLNRRRGV